MTPSKKVKKNHNLLLEVAFFNRQIKNLHETNNRF